MGDIDVYKIVFFLIICPSYSRQQTRKAMPLCFKKLYPKKTLCIVDCFQYFTKTPSGLNQITTYDVIKACCSLYDLLPPLCEYTYLEKEHI